MIQIVFENEKVHEINIEAVFSKFLSGAVVVMRRFQIFSQFVYFMNYFFFKKNGSSNHVAEFGKQNFEQDFKIGKKTYNFSYSKLHGKVNWSKGDSNTRNMKVISLSVRPYRLIDCLLL